jgi:NADH-quinone oxidoreductase subunit J
MFEFGITDKFMDFMSYIGSNIDLLIFFAVAAIGVTAALFVVTDKEPMHSAFYLALVFVIVAVMFYLLEAEFMAIVQLFVYVGAITILFAFSIMLTRKYIIKSGGDEHDD